jgi:sulfatase modifying factor 1
VSPFRPKLSIPRYGAIALLLSLFVGGIATGRAAEPKVIPDLALKLVPIPAGAFTMGSPKDEIGHFENEGPQTHVTISHPFWLGATEVTHAQWRAIMGTDLVEQVRRMLADDTLYPISGKQQTTRNFFEVKKDSDPHALVYYAADDAPMYWVNWDEASEFCHRLTERERAAGRLPEGYEYRLPTEAEWEYACRAGTTTATYAGDMVVKGTYNAPVLDAIAWYGGNSSVSYTGNGIDTAKVAGKEYPGGIDGPHAVGTKHPNDWGLYDMIGNVYEWCSDRYASRLPGGEVTDPAGPANGLGRVSCGSSWGYAAILSRSAHRDGHIPGLRNRNLGFRVELGPVR